MISDERLAEIEARCAAFAGSWSVVGGWYREDVPDLLAELRAERKRVAVLEGAIRDEAVRLVDARHGYTAEYAPGFEAHCLEYEDEERRILALTPDPGPS